MFDSVKVAYNMADAAFIGTVTSITEWTVPTYYGPYPDLDGHYPEVFNWYVFDVEMSWKGPATTRLALYTPRSISGCGMSLPVGERALVFAVHGPPATRTQLLDRSQMLMTTSCDYLGPGDAEEIAALNAIRAPQQLVAIPADHESVRVPPVPPVDDGSGLQKGRPWWHWGTLAGALVAVLIGLWLKRRPIGALVRRWRHRASGA